MKAAWIWTFIALPAAAHVVSMSTGELTIAERTATYVLKLPAHELDHVGNPDSDLPGAISIDGATMTGSACKKDAKTLVCTIGWEFPVPPPRVRVRVRLHEVTVPDHLHALHASRDGVTERLMFDKRKTDATLRFAPAAESHHYPWSRALLLALALGLAVAAATARRFRIAAVRLTAATAAGALLYYAGAQSGEGSLAVEIRDDATGQAVPAMVCITSLADGKWRVPPDGTVVPAYTRVPDFYAPREWKPGDVGPVRLTTGDYKDNQTRSSIYGTASCYPFWKEVAAYFVPRPFTIKLPAGKWRLAVERGVEYLPVFEEFDVKPGQHIKRQVRLKRWVDMARAGWYSGDDHVHHPRTRPEHDEFLLTWARAEDVHVLNIVQQRTLNALTFPQTFGNQARRVEGEFALVSGQEEPSMQIDEQGHALVLNLPEAVSDLSQFHLYDVVFDRAQKRGGVTGYAHIAWAPEWYRRTRPELFPTWDSTLNAIAGRVNFFEVLQFRMLGLDDYYDFLSLGVRLTASAGADVPWGSTIGEVRTYAYTDRPFSVDRWFEAMRKGNTFVTNGPMLLLTVNGAIPGNEVKVEPGARVRISARAWAPPEIGSPRVLEVVSMGRTLRKAESGSPQRKELRAEFTIDARESMWIAARVESHNGGLAHTSPVYLIAGGKPVLDRERAPELVKKRMAVLDHIEKKLQEPRYLKTYAPGEADAHRERVQRARATYQALLK